MKRIFFLLMIFCIVSICAVAHFSYAQSQLTPMKATVSKLQGEVVVMRHGSGTAQPLVCGAVLGSGDKVETRDNGKVEIRMDNGNTLNLIPNSQIILTNLTSNQSTGEYENLMESGFGTIRANVAQKVRGKSAFKIKTPTGICGARGTVFYLIISATGTQVFVTDGSVDFTNPNTGDTFVVVADMTALSNMTGVTEPVELTGADREAVLAAYEASLATDSDSPGGGGTEEEGMPDAPSQTNSPQTPTDNPPPSQS